MGYKYAYCLIYFSSPHYKIQVQKRGKINYEARILLKLGVFCCRICVVSDTDTDTYNCTNYVISQIISSVGVLVSVSCLVSISVSMLVSWHGQPEILIQMWCSVSAKHYCYMHKRSVNYWLLILLWGSLWKPLVKVEWNHQ